jgi:hypothetical protein
MELVPALQAGSFLLAQPWASFVSPGFHMPDFQPFDFDCVKWRPDTLKR